MSLALRVLLRFLITGVIIGTVRWVTSIIQKPAKEVSNVELGERFISSKGVSKNYFIMTICFSLVLAFATSMPLDIKGVGKAIVIGVLILIILFFLLMSFLYGQVYVRIGNDDIRWRKMNGKEQTIKYNEVTLFSVDEDGIAKIFKEDKCILTFPTYEHKSYIIGLFRNRKVSIKDALADDRIIMKMGKGYVIFDFVCIVGFVIFFLLCLFCLMPTGMLFFFVFIVLSIINYSDRKQKRIIVEDNTIIEKIPRKKEKRIKFGQVDYLTKEKGNNTYIICVHSKKGEIIQIPKYYQNFELFDLLASSKKWKWKQ